MAQYKLVKNGDKVTYKNGKNKDVKADDVPEQVKKVLEDSRPGTLVDETGTEVETYAGKPLETDDGEDENLGGHAPARSRKETKSQADELDEDEIIDPTANSVLQDADDMGMGFPRKGGKTLSVFSDAPHETVKYIAGFQVPMTLEEYRTKTDRDILVRLRELKKI